MKTMIKFAIVALSILMLVGCTSSTDNITTATKKETETVELTIDNWQDYLEIKEDYSYGYNDFDEIISIHKAYNFYLKDGMTFVENSNPKIAIEYEYDEADYYTCTNVDWKNGTFDYIELDDATKLKFDLSSTTHQSGMTTLYKDTSNSLGSIYITFVNLVNGETRNEKRIFLPSFEYLDVITKYDNFVITRIKGTIEVVK